MRIFSNDLTDGATLPERHVYNGMGFQGENLSPHLAWNEVPDGTKSFVVTCYDPDVLTGSGWWHWGVANIPASVTTLPQGAGSGRALLPAGAVQTRTDYGYAGYGGAAAPGDESHRYVFSVYALDVATLAVDEQSGGAMLGINVHNHTLASASLTVTWR